MMKMTLVDSMKRAFFTLSKRNLQFAGEYDFIVKEKKVITRKNRKGRRNKTYCVYLKSEEGLYEGAMIVHPNDFYKMKKDNPCGKRGVVIHKYKNDFHAITKNTVAKKAIREVVTNARIEFFIYLIVFILMLFSSLIFLLVIMQIISDSGII